MKATKYNIRRLRLLSGIHTAAVTWMERCRPPPKRKNKRSDDSVHDTQLLESTAFTAGFTHLWELGCFCFLCAIYRLKVLIPVYRAVNPATNGVGCRSPPQSVLPHRKTDWRKG